MMSDTRTQPTAADGNDSEVAPALYAALRSALVVVSGCNADGLFNDEEREIRDALALYEGRSAPASANLAAIHLSQYAALLDELEKLISGLAILHQVGIDHDANLARDTLELLVDHACDLLEMGRRNLDDTGTNDEVQA